LTARIVVGAKLDGKIEKLTYAGVVVEIAPAVTGMIFQSDFKLAYPEASSAPVVGERSV
jgi:ribosomal protein S1